MSIFTAKVAVYPCNGIDEDGFVLLARCRRYSSVVERVLGKDEVMGSTPISGLDAIAESRRVGMDRNVVEAVA